MGWLKLGARSNNFETFSVLEAPYHDYLKASTQHIESVPIQSDAKSTNVYPYISPSVPDSDLPHIPAAEVKKRKSSQEGNIWIVVDNIVYDCSVFIHEHPGGEAIIEGFGGAECSWQFWRFHGKKEMDDFGKPLRVGRTEGLINRYKEPVKYVGLRRAGLDQW